MRDLGSTVLLISEGLFSDRGLTVEAADACVSEAGVPIVEIVGVTGVIGVIAGCG